MSGGGHLLIVDDDPELLKLLHQSLSQSDIHCCTAADGREALALIRERSFDLVVLDWTLPDLSGIAVLQRMRSTGVRTPVLMLTARDDDERVKALDAGADDYLTKPFELKELQARVRAQLRRGLYATADNTTAQLELGDLRIDLLSRTVQRGERQLNLSQREFELLCFLVREPNRVHSRQSILDGVWGSPFIGDPNTLDVYLGYLRRKVERTGQAQLLHTVRGVGVMARWERPRLSIDQGAVRKAQLQVSADAGVIGDHEFATHQAHQLIHQGQPKTTAAGAGGGTAALKALDHPLAFPRGNARALIDNMKHNGVGVQARLQPHRPLAVGQCVVHQCRQALLDPIRVHPDRWQRLGRGGIELQPGRGQRLQPLKGKQQQFLGVERMPIQLQTTGVTTGQLEHHLQQLGHPINLGRQQRQLVGRRWSLLPLLQVTGDHADRCTQLMGHAIHKRPLLLPGQRQTPLQVIEGLRHGPQLQRLRGGINQGAPQAVGLQRRDLAIELIQGQQQPTPQHRTQQRRRQQHRTARRGHQQPLELALALDRLGHVLPQQQPLIRWIRAIQSRTALQPETSVECLQLRRSGGAGWLKHRGPTQGRIRLQQLPQGSRRIDQGRNPLLVVVNPALLI